MRTNYRNGDPIKAPRQNCDGCCAVIHDRKVRHKPGCRKAWKDTLRECVVCWRRFYPDAIEQQECLRCLTEEHREGLLDQS